MRRPEPGERMPTRDARIDAYIARAGAFARPILERLRADVHAACPAVEETMKWSRPHFMYRGMLCGMSAFKAHVAFGFWKGSLLLKGGSRKDGAMGQFGRLTSVGDLPTRAAIRALVRAAMALNESGVKSPRRVPRAPRPPPRVPADLRKALAGDARARRGYQGLSPSGQREYVQWLEEAKRAETRAKRLATTLQWLAQGKGRNWQYERRATR